MKIFEKLESLGFFEWLKEKGFGIGFTVMILDNQPVDSIERTGYNAIAFRWFREKYGLDSFVKAEWQQMVKIGYYFSADDYYSEQPSHLTYEEAELACLEKLIEIVEKN